MKLAILSMTIVLFSCTQNTRETNSQTVELVNDSIKQFFHSHKLGNELSFAEILNNFYIRNLPIKDTTNFDSFIDEKKSYSKEEITLLQLKKIYPNFFNEGYNYSAFPSYKINFSNNFYSIVIVIFKGNNEMESVLINYDLKGKLLDYKVITYDEIAEGWSRIVTDIEENKLIIYNISWIDKKQVETSHFEINWEGKIQPK